MVNREAAIRAGDALLQAERQRRDRQSARGAVALTLRYSILKKVPASARRHLVRAARLQAMRHRGVQFLACASLGALLRVVYLTAVRGEPDSMSRWWPPLLGFFAVAIWSQLETRRRLSQLVRGYGITQGETRVALPRV
jgi:hypothetical protein